LKKYFGFPSKVSIFELTKYAPAHKKAQTPVLNLCKSLTTIYFLENPITKSAKYKVGHFSSF
jgi:hypothetical protein